jgi:hypothetical protein
MSKFAMIKRIFGGLAGVLLVLAGGYMLLRPIHLRWGATDAEVAQAMPGDLDGMRWTRAITVNAPPEKIWPWLVQFGQGRGGWYSYDWLENLLGFDIHTAGEILPQYQNPALGDAICMARTQCVSVVSVIQPQRWFGWETRGEDGQSVWSFTLGLQPIDATHTRLLVRETFSPSALPAPVIFIIEIPDVVMEQKALATLKSRAEGTPGSPLVTGFEIAAWLAALAMGLAAGWLFVGRQDWRPPLAMGVASVICLLVLSFLFPPLWLRGALDLGLLAGLGWCVRARQS